MAELLDNLISLSSLEGAVLARAQPAAAPMWSLLAHFETQHTQSFCSIATAAMLLNVLGVAKPIDPVPHPPARLYLKAHGAPTHTEAQPTGQPGASAGAARRASALPPSTRGASHRQASCC